LRKYATQNLLICPPHLHNAAALPWEILVSSCQLITRWFFFGSICRWLWKKPFLVLR